MQQVELRKSDQIQEVSLIDLLIVFIRYKRIFISAFIFLMVLVGAFAFVVPTQYGYVTLVQLAEEDRGAPLESPQAVSAWMVAQVVPEVETGYVKEFGRKMPFEMELETPADTALIKISSNAREKDSADVERVHSQLVAKLEQRQQALEKRYMDGLERQIDSVDRSIEVLGELTDAGPALAAAMEKKTELERSILQFNRLEQLSVSQRSVEKVSKGPAFILVIGMLVSGLMAILITFVWAAFSYARKRAALSQG